MENTSEYKLRCSLSGHTQDVRALDVSDEGHIATASRDKTARLWVCNDKERKSFEEKVVYSGHTGYIISICFIPASSEHVDGLTATGSQDKSILIFKRFASEPLHSLLGHTDQVSCLRFGCDFLVSSSWDNSVRVWAGTTSIQQLTGHTAAVWGVEIMNTENGPLILSASADKTIKSWRAGQLDVTFSGHEDCVRGLTLVDSEHFLSCSNDSSVRKWHISGQCIEVFYGHTNYVYRIMFSAPHAMFVTGGEDRCLRLWHSSGSSKQTIHLPAQSVWCVGVLSCGDVVTGSSDGLTRIFTSNSERQASDEDIKAYEEAVAACPVYNQDVGGIKIEKLPDATHLCKEGTKEGQTTMIKEGGKAIAYSWSMSKKIWEKVGEVVGGTGGTTDSSGKVLFEGKEYDYVFDVDIDAGRSLRLPFNRSEDPWMAAQKFIQEHELPQDFLDQVANFIISSATGIASSGGANYVDPFTGGSRYIPQGSGSSGGVGAAGASGGAIPSGDFDGADPFTGGNRHVPQPLTNPSQSSIFSQFFPQKTPLSFESYNQNGMLSKLNQNNSINGNTLTEEETKSIVEAVANPSMDPILLAPLEKSLNWPAESIWPVLDVIRLALRSQKIQEEWFKNAKMGDVIADLLASFIPASPIPTTLLSIRCLANFACHPPGRDILVSKQRSILGPTAALSPYANKNLEIASATLFLNYSIFAAASNDLDFQCQVLSGSAALILSSMDEEAQFRSLVSLGTLLTGSSGDGNGIKALAASLDIKSVVEALAGRDTKVGLCARDLIQFL